jgi:hypothetical protein
MLHDAFGQFADISLKFRWGQRPSGNSHGSLLDMIEGDADTGITHPRPAQRDRFSVEQHEHAHRAPLWERRTSPHGYGRRRDAASRSGSPGRCGRSRRDQQQARPALVACAATPPQTAVAGRVRAGQKIVPTRK